MYRHHAVSESGFNRPVPSQLNVEQDLLLRRAVPHRLPGSLISPSLEAGHIGHSLCLQLLAPPRLLLPFFQPLRIYPASLYLWFVIVVVVVVQRIPLSLVPFSSPPLTAVAKMFSPFAVLPASST